MRTLCFFIEPLLYNRCLVQLDKATTFTGRGAPVALVAAAAALMAALAALVLGEFPDCIRVKKCI